jgi:hypothetical protein
MENHSQVMSERLRRAIVWRQVTRDILRLLYWGVALGLLPLVGTEPGVTIRSSPSKEKLAETCTARP